jgi:hypothetical protein
VVGVWPFTQQRLQQLDVCQERPGPLRSRSGSGPLEQHPRTCLLHGVLADQDRRMTAAAAAVLWLLR